MDKFDLAEKMLKDHKEGKIGVGEEPGDIGADIEMSSSSTQAEKILELVSGLELFHDEHGVAYTFIDFNAVMLESKKFKQWLSHKFKKEAGKVPNKESLSQAVSAMVGDAIFEQEEKKLYVRVADKDSAFYYDMGNGKVVKTTTKGWELTEAPILFRRHKHQQIQVMPKKGGNPWRLFDFINISNENDHELLILVLIISYFIPDIAHPIFHLHGTQGSGKTTLFKITKIICDPSSAGVLISPTNRDQLIQVLSHHYVCLFDNMSYIKQDMSDILCMASTGGGCSKRELFSNDEDFIYHFKHCIGINGIAQLIYKPDLMDRSILLHLNRITPEKRKEEVALWSSFDKALPGILGGIFDAISTAMAIYPKVRIDGLPRMADFAKWGYAIAEALGVRGERFLKAYHHNISQQNEEVIQGSTLAQAVLSLIEDEPRFEGTVKEAFRKLKENAGNFPTTDNSFPKAPNKLKNALEKIRPNLTNCGITY